MPARHDAGVRTSGDQIRLDTRGISATRTNFPTRSGTIFSDRYGTLNVGGTQAADAQARLDVWPRLLAFLASGL
jgi:hypothetical protein